MALVWEDGNLLAYHISMRYQLIYFLSADITLLLHWNSISGFNFLPNFRHRRVILHWPTKFRQIELLLSSLVVLCILITFSCYLDLCVTWKLWFDICCNELLVWNINEIWNINVKKSQVISENWQISYGNDQSVIDGKAVYFTDELKYLGCVLCRPHACSVFQCFNSINAKRSNFTEPIWQHLLHREP